MQVNGSRQVSGPAGDVVATSPYRGLRGRPGRDAPPYGQARRSCPGLAGTLAALVMAGGSGPAHARGLNGVGRVAHRCGRSRAPGGPSEVGEASMTGMAAGAAHGGPVRAGSSAPLVVEWSGSRRSLEPGAAYAIGRDLRCAVVVRTPGVAQARRGARRGRPLGDRRRRQRQRHLRRRQAGGADGDHRGCMVRLADPASGPDVRLVPGGSRRRTSRRSRRCGSNRGLPVENPVRRSPPATRRWRSRTRCAGWCRTASGSRTSTSSTTTTPSSTTSAGSATSTRSGVPARRWRLVVVSDPELLERVATDEEQFGKRVEDINFFSQLSNSRGGGHVGHRRR